MDEQAALIWWSAAASALHMLALGIGLGAAFARAKALRGKLDEAGIARVLFADNFWGLAALLWVGTGLWRVFGTVAKTSAYYLHNHVFFAKIGLFVTILLLEVWPMVTLIRWRIALAKKKPIDTRQARTLGAITYVEVALVLVIPFFAALMARGVGMMR